MCHEINQNCHIAESRAKNGMLILNVEQPMIVFAPFTFTDEVHAAHVPFRKERQSN
jgi:hypothetical protein